MKKQIFAFLALLSVFTIYSLQAMEQESNNSFLIIVPTKDLAPMLPVGTLIPKALKNLGTAFQNSSWMRSASLVAQIGFKSSTIVDHGKAVAKTTKGLGNIVSVTMIQLKKDYALTEAEAKSLLNYGVELVADSNPNRDIVKTVDNWNNNNSAIATIPLIKALIERKASFVGGLSDHDPISFPIYIQKLRDKQIYLNQLLPTGCVIRPLAEGIQRPAMQQQQLWNNWSVVETQKWFPASDCIEALKGLGKSVKNIYIFSPDSAKLQKTWDTKEYFYAGCKVHFVSSQEELADFLNKEQGIPNRINNNNEKKKVTFNDDHNRIYEIDNIDLEESQDLENNINSINKAQSTNANALVQHSLNNSYNNSKKYSSDSEEFCDVEEISNEKFDELNSQNDAIRIDNSKPLENNDSGSARNKEDEIPQQTNNNSSINQLNQQFEQIHVEQENNEIKTEELKKSEQPSFFARHKNKLFTGFFAVGIAATAFSAWKYTKSSVYSTMPKMSWFDALKSHTQGWWRYTTGYLCNKNSVSA